MGNSSRTQQLEAARRCLSPRPLIIRPSGVWNSRSPFNEYFAKIKEIDRAKSIQGLGIYKLLETIRNTQDKTRTAATWLAKYVKVPLAGSKFRERYVRSYKSQSTETKVRPNLSDILSDSDSAFNVVQESSFVKLSSTFESFVQCWALNMLLTALESRRARRLTKLEENIAVSFCPFGDGMLPSAPKIILSIDPAYKLLSSTPRLFIDPLTKSKVNSVSDPGESAFVAMMFWRDYRNLSIHFGGIVTRSFYSKHASYFQKTMRTLNHIKLEVGRPLPFHGELYGAMAASHYRAAVQLNEWLERASEGRRGHPEAPNIKTRDSWSEPPRSRPLLMKGDHELSLDWANDTNARREIARDRGWNLERINMTWADYY